MADKTKELLVYCAECDFGTIRLTEREKNFQDELNQEIISLCKSLPQSTQIQALLFLIKYLKAPLPQGLDFFNYFYVPAWSIIYWLIHMAPVGGSLGREDIKNAKIAHSMAMFLHPLDDHLSDGQLPITHLTLLLRSEAWRLMTTALMKFSDDVYRGREIVRELIDDYYSSINDNEELESLDSYCERFKKQMATSLTVPVLIAKKMTADDNLAHAVHSLYGSFGISWRLLDDIIDINEDMMKGIHSAIYHCLPRDLRNRWNKIVIAGSVENSDHAEAVLNYILRNKVINKLNNKICSQLKSAESIADDYGIGGLAEELRCLAKPLKNRQEPLWT